MIGERARTRKNGAGKANGAQGRNRTTDTAIFSRMLYQLSYLGISQRPKRPVERAVYSGVGRPCPPRFACGFAWRGHPMPQAKRARQSPTGVDGRPASPRSGKSGQTAESGSIRVVRLVVAGRNHVGTREPAVQVDIPAARGAERPRVLGGRLAADRAGLGLSPPGDRHGFRVRWRWHSTTRSGSGSPRPPAA